MQVGVNFFRWGLESLLPVSPSYHFSLSLFNTAKQLQNQRALFGNFQEFLQEFS